MKRMISILLFSLLISTVFLPLGCGHKEEDSHGHDEESPSGASFKEGKGITVKEETAKILGLEVVDVVEEVAPQIVELDIQIFTEKHRIADLNLDHGNCAFHGSGFLPLDESALVKPKEKVKFKTLRGEELEGFVVSVQEPLKHGEVEIIVGVTTPESALKDGEFVKASILVPRSEPVTVIPTSALLRTAEGTYVYVVNGNSYLRTPVAVGGVVDGKIEITDGLYAGDQVVAKPVETLWIIELRATKGGGHSH